MKWLVLSGPVGFFQLLRELKSTQLYMYEFLTLILTSLFSVFIATPSARHSTFRTHSANRSVPFRARSLFIVVPRKLL